MDTIRWGIIGIGNIVNSSMAPGMLDDPNSEIVAATSRDQGRADAFVEKFGAKFAYTDYDEMLANPEIDAVFIATPNSQHAEQTVAAAQAGKHVLCDKPMSLSVADAVREIEACRSAGVKLGINFHNRRLQWVNDAKAMVADGTLGEIQNFIVEASAGVPPRDWRNNKELSGLGTTYSQGVHVFDFIRYILGSDPVEVTAVYDDQGGKYEVETQCLATIRYASGTLAFANINQRIVFPKNDLGIYGTKGRFYGAGLTRSRLDGNISVLLEGQEETTTFYPQPSGQAHKRNLAAFTAALVAGEEPNASGIDGLHSMILTEAIAKSASEGRTVALDYSSVEALRSS